MQEFLIVLPLPETLAPSVERFIRAGVAFLETVGDVERHNVGKYARSTRNGQEVLNLVVLSAANDARTETQFACARSLETVLRSALAAAKAPTSDVRVFVQTIVAPEGE